MKKQVLVTVGTTKFEKLIKAIDQEDFYKLLDTHGFTDLIIQKGTGEYEPCIYQSMKFNTLNVTVGKLFPYFENIIIQSDYVISHGGAGIILESLKNKKKLIIAVNDLLMDNHQVELAEALEKDNYAFYCRDVGNITSDLKTMLESNDIKLSKYPDFNLEVIPRVINEMLDIN
jgi:beta-1,4-N-acetylglucosaminyltransferase